MTRAARNSDAALAAFLARQVEVDTMPARLQALSNGHFNAAPEQVSWTHVSTLARHAELPKRLTGGAFGEGEFAARADLA